MRPDGWRAEHEHSRLHQPPSVPQGLGRASVLSSASTFLSPSARLARRARRPSSSPNAFIRIAPDNTVTVICKHIEFGQGPYTGIATILADELDADWAQIKRRIGAGGRQQVRQLRLRSRAGHRRLDRHGQLVGPAAHRRRRGPRAPHRGGGQGVGRRCGLPHHREGRRQRPVRQDRNVRRTRRPRAADRAARPVQAEGSERLEADRPQQAAEGRHAAEDQRHGDLHHRRQDAEHADVPRGASDALRR